MSSLISLKNLLYKLKKEEVKCLINFINLNQKSENKGVNQSVKLIKLLIRQQSLTSNELQLILYDKANYTAFNKLIYRIKDKIYEILIFDQNLEKSISAKRNRTIFDIKKKLIQSEIMFSRGINEELKSFQNKIISTAKQFEIYDGLIEALQAKQRYVGFRSGFKANQKIKYEINFYEQCRDAYNRALEIYNSISSKINFSFSTIDYENELEEAIVILQRDYEKTHSASVSYYYFLLLTEYYQSRNDLLSARGSLIKLKELTEQNVSIYTKNRIGNAYINLANNEFLMHNFDQCLLFNQKATHYLAESAVNIGIIKELEFNVLFFSGKLEDAEKLIHKLYNDSRVNNTPFLYAKRAYLFACLKTFKKQYAQSNELLLELKDIERDKDGWNLGKRILTIINRIETNNFESADLQVLNLQKHIKRTLKIKHVRKRDIIILRILIKLINEHFDFNKVYNSRRRYFDLLESNEIEYMWKIKSPELIIFHEWFKSKIEHRPYNHFVVLNKVHGLLYREQKL